MAGFASVFCGEDCRGPTFVAFTRADFDQRADNRADHVVEEAVAVDFDNDTISGFGKRCTTNSRHVEWTSEEFVGM